MVDPPRFDPTIAAYYQQAPEETRLEQLPFRLEEIRTRELIQRHAPAPAATVVDVGGVVGAYAIWLAEAGCWSTGRRRRSCSPGTG